MSDSLTTLYCSFAGDTEEDAEGDDKDSEANAISKGDRSHLIVWQIFQKR